MFYKPVYKCDLLSVTKDIRVNNDESIRKNIADAETENICTVLVQETWNPSYVKEILTGQKIPVYRTLHYKNSTVLNGTIEREIPDYPCFIKYDMDVGDEGEILSRDLVLATAPEVSQYIDQHKMKGDFALYLYEVLKRGERLYNESKAKGIVIDRKQIRQMLKSIKK